VRVGGKSHETEWDVLKMEAVRAFETSLV
jgi:hypothetical protein